MAKTIDDLEKRITLYEENGPAKAAYAINRKLNELANMLNKHNVSELDIADPKDKTFERLKIAWSEMASLGTAYKTLAESAGITNDEKKDVLRKPFTDTIAEDRK
jgi:hypothetical protein